MTPEQQALDRIVAAWTVEGQVPRWHREMKDRVRRTWPVLARELDRAATIARPRRS